MRRYQWEETPAGGTATVSCRFGPIGNFASRMCQSKYSWGKVVSSDCATTLTEGFDNLNKMASAIILVSYYFNDGYGWIIEMFVVG